MISSIRHASYPLYALLITAISLLTPTTSLAADIPINLTDTRQLVLKALPDPCVIRVADTYYAYGTTDPGQGFQAYKSQNLTDWQSLGFVFKKTESSWGQKHYWAPCVVQKNNKFYLFYSTFGPINGTWGRAGHRIGVAISESGPQGPFIEQKIPLFGVGKSIIDAEVFIDNDGSAYLYYVLDISENKRSEIFVVKLSDDLLSIADQWDQDDTTSNEPVWCAEPIGKWEGKQWNEGPNVFRVDKWYIMMYSANGFFTPDYSVGYAIAPSPRGPWFKSPSNPIIKKDPSSAPNPIVGTGHSDVVQDPTGQYYIFYHAHSQDRGVKRRDLYAQKLYIQPDKDLILKLTLTPQPAPHNQSTSTPPIKD
ncbi:Beta-xylosidase [Poriferisphaera corsica]|uniref:Beta-xylosidase n=1 Tax=Poriferisphaera corsica TaxID=2528020 RepID=A0A517YQX0_9BACT|nr:glycoside hydrolase family 43 protein [Poriferisphaera corsica]QDU32630.1 Beta-xylosidase [Poriferisphaera corsica]